MSRMFVWGLERAKCEGDCMENGVRVFLVGHRKLLVVGAACVRPMHPVTFLNRHAAVCCVLRGRNERTGGYSPQILLIFL